MKSEVLEMKERGSGEYKQLEIKLRIENDAGEILPEYMWYVTPNRAGEVLADEEKLKDELAIATQQGLDYMEREKNVLENAKKDVNKLDLEKVLTKKVKKGLTKEGIDEYVEKNKIKEPKDKEK